MKRKFKDYLKEGRGISDIIKEYSNVIYNFYLKGDKKIQIDLDHKDLPLIDLRIEFILSDRFYSVYDPSYSRIENDQLHDINILIEIDKNFLEKHKIIGIITHELTHIKEYYEINKILNNIDIKIRPTWIDIKLSYKKLNIDVDNKYYYFIYLVYLSLDTEMNARVSQVYQYLYDFRTDDKDYLLTKLKEHKNWEYLNMLRNFDYKDFINNNINDINLDGLLDISNKFLFLLKDKNLNKNTILLKFLNKRLGSIEDLENFYRNWRLYFLKKSKKHEEKFKQLIIEVIEDIKGNRPYNENYRSETKK